MTAVPLQLTFEKLRGFVLDHNARIVSIKNDRVELHIDAEAARCGRRRADRTIGFAVELHLAEQRVPTAATDGRPPGRIARTRVRVGIRLKKARDRRSSDALGRANMVLASLKSYLMASDEAIAPDQDSLQRAASMTSLWLSGERAKRLAQARQPDRRNRAGTLATRHAATRRDNCHFALNRVCWRLAKNYLPGGSSHAVPASAAPVCV